LVAACSTSTNKKATGTTTTSTAKPTGASGGTADTACAKTTPAETAGPFPADGSNGPNVLGEDGVVRSDIRTSFGVLSGWAEGVQTTIELTLLDIADNCAKGEGMAVYLWHCDRAGSYSMYAGARPTRTTFAAFRSPTRTAGCPSPRSSRPAGPTDGHTST
jgi:protocatechuate 3,4-dioxygenase beta subunit